MTPALWTSREAASATGAAANGDWRATGVSIDSRTLEPGDLFVALKGPHHDGHDHVAAALRAGAAAALVERVVAGVAASSLLVAPDALEALRRLGLAARARNTSGKIFAVTGSVGKTGTKEALKLALAAQGAVHASAGSYNNHIGVPLTLARLPEDAAFGVFEIGMNHAGEIAPLVRMVRPHVAIVTTVEAVHIENFADGIAGVAAAKAEIFAGGAGGVAVINRDNPFFDALSQRARSCGAARVIGFGEHPAAEARLAGVRLEPTASVVSAVIDGRELTYRVAVPGKHWALNSLAVLAAIAAVGADIGKAAAALGQLAAPKGRGRRHLIGRAGAAFELIDDSYNASPVSMRAAFQVLASAGTGPGGRRVAVLGDMLELGSEAPALHAGLAEALVAAGIDQVFTCGQHMAHLHDALPPALRAGHAPNSERLIPLVRAALRQGDVVVVKGSYGSRMGRVVDALLAGEAGGASDGRAVNG